MHTVCRAPELTRMPRGAGARTTSDLRVGKSKCGARAPRSEAQACR